MAEPRGWSKSLWGVVLTCGADDDRPMLIGDRWNSGELLRARYVGEPPRALLFTTREEARDWCAETNARYEARPETDASHYWRFRPVRVTEEVRVDRVNA